MVWFAEGPGTVVQLGQSKGPGVKEQLGQRQGTRVYLVEEVGTRVGLVQGDGLAELVQAQGTVGVLQALEWVLGCRRMRWLGGSEISLALHLTRSVVPS